MTNKVNKSTLKSDAMQELILMCHSIRAMREQIDSQLDAMLDRINQLLPAQECRQSAKFKNSTKDDWRNFLEF